MVNGGGWTVGVGRLALRGDVLVRAYRRPAQAHVHAHAPQRHLVFACQFHTCAVADHTLSFTKQQLDHAVHGKSLALDLPALLAIVIELRVLAKFTNTHNFFTRSFVKIKEMLT